LVTSEEKEIRFPIILQLCVSISQKPEFSSSNKPNGPPEAIKVVSNSQVPSWAIFITWKVEPN